MSVCSMVVDLCWVPHTDTLHICHRVCLKTDVPLGTEVVEEVLLNCASTLALGTVVGGVVVASLVDGKTSSHPVKLVLYLPMYLSC